MTTTAKKLTDYSAEEQLELPYVELCRLRREHWQAHVAGMSIPDSIKAWAAAMTEKYGAGVKVHGHHVHEHVLDWPTALMVIRYGEATHVLNEEGELVQFWPNTFSDDDVRRANKWLTGKDAPPAEVIKYLKDLPPKVQKAYGFVPKKEG